MAQKPQISPNWYMEIMKYCLTKFNTNNKSTQICNNMETMDLLGFKYTLYSV